MQLELICLLCDINLCFFSLIFYEHKACFREGFIVRFILKLVSFLFPPYSTGNERLLLSLLGKFKSDYLTVTALWYLCFLLEVLMYMLIIILHLRN
jgi:hypothetical protein